MVDMYDAGWSQLAAFDYAEAGVARARALFGARRSRGRRVLGCHSRELVDAIREELELAHARIHDEPLRGTNLRGGRTCVADAFVRRERARLRR